MVKITTPDSFFINIDLHNESYVMKNLLIFSTTIRWHSNQHDKGVYNGF